MSELNLIDTRIEQYTISQAPNKYTNYYEKMNISMSLAILCGISPRFYGDCKTVYQTNKNQAVIEKYIALYLILNHLYMGILL